ncbi:MAG: DUF87 domain-containing protein [Candidatus Cloacimonetes bacterium]|nr:DUF87 domain-containing protein [Candidatus Cloacimonadota bacterium]
MKNKDKEKKPKSKIILGFILIALGALLFFSLLSFTYDDIVSLKQAELTFKKIVTLDFPYTRNMIGPFGAGLAWVFQIIFSEPFSFFLSVFLFITGILYIFGSKIENLTRKLVFIFLFFVWLTLFYLSVGGAFPICRGVVFTLIINKIFYPIFNSVGSAIILGLALFGTIIFIFEAKNILNFLKSLFTPSEKQKRVKVKTKPEAKRKPEISYKKPEAEPELPTKKHKKDRAKKEKKKPEPIVTKPQKAEDKDDSSYPLPNYHKMLQDSPSMTKQALEEKRKEVEEKSHLLQSKLKEFDIEGEVVNVNIGPVITQYELRPAPGTKISKYTSLADDLALALKAKSIRIVAPIPGKDTIGFEIPNNKSEFIYLKEVLDSDEMKNNPSPTLIALGKDITGKPVVTDLKDLRHLLIAGETGSGKSVCLNTILNSFLYRAHPDQVRLILFDPKKIELSLYKNVPHLIKEVITDFEDVVYLLNWAVNEMEHRYDSLAKYHVRDLASYNEMCIQKKNEYDQIKDKKDELPDLEELPQTMPYLVIVVDELADLMQKMAKDIERPIQRLAGMARAVGIYLIFATQRPSVNVINGVIKANFPSRISFHVSSKTDSRTILDINGAEKLLGRGDMLFSPLGRKPPIRVHGSYVGTEEAKKLVDYLSQYPQPEIDIKLPTDIDNDGEFAYDDDLFPQAIRYAVEKKYASISMMQRKFRIGYARAGRLIDQMQRAGFVQDAEGSKPRKVLIGMDDLERLGY